MGRRLHTSGLAKKPWRTCSGKQIFFNEKTTIRQKSILFVKLLFAKHFYEKKITYEKKFVLKNLNNVIF